MGPWTAVAPLMALCTDPHEEIRGRALRLLRTLCDKYPRYLDADRLCSGVVEAFNFRWALAQVGGRAGVRASGRCVCGWTGAGRSFGNSGATPLHDSPGLSSSNPSLSF